MFTSVSAPLDTCPIAHPPLPACSLAGNNLTNNGKDMSGLLKLVEILPLTKIESLGCAAAAASSVCFCGSALPPSSLTVPILPLAHSLAANRLDDHAKHAIKHAASSGVAIHF